MGGARAAIEPPPPPQRIGPPRGERQVTQISKITTASQKPRPAFDRSPGAAALAETARDPRSTWSCPARRAAREELEHRLCRSCYLALPCVDGTDRHSAVKILDYDSDCESISEAPPCLRWSDAGRLHAVQCVSYHRSETMNLTWRDGCLRPADGADPLFSWRGRASAVGTKCWSTGAQAPTLASCWAILLAFGWGF
jgi:hypothetical protein